MTKYYINGPYRCVECFQFDMKLPNDHSKCNSCVSSVSNISSASNISDEVVQADEPKPWWHRLKMLSLGN